MEHVEGVIRQYLFFNEENSYSVLKVELTDTSEKSLAYYEPTIVVCGFFPKLETAVKYRFYGAVTDHPRYGKQYAAERFERIVDNTRAGLVDYLSSGLVKGVGPKTAERIVDALGTDTLAAIAQDVSALDKVPKLNKELKQAIREAVLENRQKEAALIWLYGFDISPRMAMRIFSRYGHKAIDVVKADPYVLIDDVEGIGFRRADEIGLKIGFGFDNPKRIQAVILFLLQEYAGKYGDTYLDKARLMEYAAKYLTAADETFIESAPIEEALETLALEEKIVVTAEAYSLAAYYRAEKGIARRLLDAAGPDPAFRPDLVGAYVADFEAQNDIQYTDNQKTAIETALSQRFTIVTGGPGTGKTTVIKGIVATYEAMHSGDPRIASKIRLCAPTGKAAKRLSDATGREATTIHRLLGYDFEGHFAYDERARLDARLVVVDEASMMDAELAFRFFGAVRDNAKIVIVGDDNQLPSVGPGQVLSDLMASGRFPVVRLEKIHRQAEGSSIVALAYDILNQRLTDDVLANQPDRTWFRAPEDRVPELVLRTLREAQNAGYDLNEDVQVLAPMYRGECGIDNLNRLIQDAFNKNHEIPALTRGEKSFRLRDKVLQLVNQPEDGIMNGDIGVVTAILDEREMLVDFGGHSVKYDVKDLDALTLAYAVSIHKSQGSEFRLVVMPVVRSHAIMLKRKLLYTAVTRAKEKLVMIGEVPALRRGVLGLEPPRRTMLSRFLSETPEPEPGDNLRIEDFM
ncbi:MAG: ATP-dependent RecD-like DNA helicase [Candidatus Izemoplasmatales bacterium]